MLDLSGYARQSDIDYMKGKDLTEKQYLVYIPRNRYLTKITNTENISSWQFMGVASDLIKPLKTTLAPQLLYHYSYSMQAYIKGGCLANENKSVSDKKVLNIYIVYGLDNTSHNFHPKFINCLFGSVNVTKKHSDFNGQTLSGYGICFYTDYVFYFLPVTFAYNTIISDADNPGRENKIAIGRGNKKINNKTTSVSASYGQKNISRTKNSLVLSIHYNSGKNNSHIFDNSEKITDFTAKDSGINSEPICLGNISETFSEKGTKRQDCMEVCIILVLIMSQILLIIS